METKTLRQQFEEETGKPAISSLLGARGTHHYTEEYSKWLESRLSAPLQKMEVSDEEIKEIALKAYPIMPSVDNKMYDHNWFNRCAYKRGAKDIRTLLRSSVEGKPETFCCGYKKMALKGSSSPSVSDKAVKNWKQIKKEFEKEIASFNGTPPVDYALDWLEQYYPVPCTDKGALKAFVKEVQKEFPEANLEYLDFALDRFISNSLTVSDKEDEAVKVDWDDLQNQFETERYLENKPKPLTSEDVFYWLKSRNSKEKGAGNG